MLHKFMDDSTLNFWRVVNLASMMDDYFHNAVEWSRDNLMNINYKKTKRMLLGTVNRQQQNESLNCWWHYTRMSVFKLGLHVESYLKRSSHVDHISATVFSRLYFLKQPSKCWTNIGDMLHFYTAIIRPVLESCLVFSCPRFEGWPHAKRTVSICFYPRLSSASPPLADLFMLRCCSSISCVALLFF